MEERLQKVLAAAGVASRRKCEEIILAGRVEVNDKVVSTLGVKVNPHQDVIKVDGRAIQNQEKIYILFNKPKGVITSVSDPEGRRVVGDFLKGIKERVYPVGRLDYDTEGLLILTNDGEFANMVTHPRHHVSKTYHATVKGVPHGSVLEKLREGVKLEDGMTRLKRVKFGSIPLVGLPRGKFRRMRKEEVQALLNEASQSHKVQKGQ
ncbi:pseudouridine synthase [Paenibacillus larvae]|nr:pseudouridine synthase [Paenibacillus larvae]MDT2242416.1 pseudouridine synthase [Paenibacillus larvae]